MVGQDVVYFKMLINLIQTLVYIKIEGKHTNMQNTNFLNYF